MTNEVYEASIYEITQDYSNYVVEINERLEHNDTSPFELLFMIGGKVSVTVAVYNINNVGVDGITRIKDGFGNVVAIKNWSVGGSSSHGEILFDAKPFENYSVEFEITNNPEYISKMGLIVEGYVHRKSKFVSIKDGVK